MGKDELLDLVDKNDNIIGEVWKSKAHGDSTKIHREVAIAIFNQKDEVLLQRRSLNKANDPGAWKITAAGHVGKGEDPKVAIKREVLEELGIHTAPKYLYKFFSKYHDKESRFFWVYYDIVDGDVALTIDKNEVMETKWVNLGNIEEFLKSDENSYKITMLAAKKIQ